MSFDVSFRDYKLDLDLEDVRIRAIDASHGVFIQSFPRHMHSFYELHYIAGGHGRLILDDAEYELTEGKLFLLAPKVNHAQFNDKSDCMEEYCFSFEVRPKKSQTDSKIGDLFFGSDVYICDDKRGIGELFLQLRQELHDREISYITASKAILERILILTARDLLSETPEASAERSLPDDRRALLMDEAFLFSYRTLTLDGLARLLNISPRHTERLIYEKYGESFVKMRMQSRLNAAAGMLDNKELTLSEIAERCGFSSYIHFSSAFKKAFGMPPSEYRKKINGGF